MRWLRNSLLVAATGGLLCGGQAEAESGPSTTRFAQTTAAPTSLISADIQLPTPSGAVFLNQEALFHYQLFLSGQENLRQESIMLVLAKTNAKEGENLDTENTFWVIQLFPCLNGECPEKSIFESNVRVPVGWTFERNTNISEDSDFRNFFICFGSYDSANTFACRAFSDFFDILASNTNSNAVSSDGKSSQDPRPGLNGVPEAGDAIAGGNRQSDAADSNQEEVVRPARPTEPLILETITPFVTYKGMPTLVGITQTRASPATLTSMTSTTTATNTMRTTVSSSSNQSSNGGGRSLPGGAIAGIAVGVLVILSILAALAVFFCLRRRKRAQSGAEKHEQVMLTHAHGENNSQDLLAEKDVSVQHTLIHPNSNDSNFSRHTRNPTDSALRQTLIPAGGSAYDGAGRGHDSPNALATGSYRDVDETRQIQLSPYDRDDNSRSHVDNTTSSFTATATATANSAPRRHPTNASTAPSAISALSRSVSTSTTNSHASLDYPRHTQLQDIGEEPAPNRGSAHPSEGQARYGETRHTPTFHTGANGGVSIVPSGALPSEPGARGSPVTGGFLSEPGMSAEDMARLEEEERRIDLAIAEAERERSGR